MKKIKIVTPENIEVEYTLADVGSRTAAAIIDLMLQGLMALVLFIAVLLISQASGYFWEQYYGWIVGITLLIYGIIISGYFILMELTMNGRTPGKKILKLRAIRNNGQPITLKHSAIRNLFRVFIDLFGVGVAMIFITKENKRLGDLVASTMVVLEDEKAQPISLENLMKINPQFTYYLSQEEQELLRGYMERRNTMKNHEELRREMQAYFTNKFGELGMLEQWKEFIDQL